MAAEHHDDDARQAGLDQGVGKAPQQREVLVVGRTPAQDEQHDDLVDDERPDAGERHPAGKAAAKHALGDLGDQIEHDESHHQQGAQEDGQHAYALDLAAHDFAPELGGVAIRGRFGHHPSS